MPVFNHMGIVVSDLERSRRFYQDVLGFRVWYEDSSVPDEATAKLLGLRPPLGAELCYLELDGCAIELIALRRAGSHGAAAERPMSETGLSHLSVSVDDIRATAARAVECGGSIVESSDLGVALMVRDPDGQLIELLTMDYPNGRPPGPGPDLATREEAGLDRAESAQSRRPVPHRLRRRRSRSGAGGVRLAARRQLADRRRHGAIDTPDGSVGGPDHVRALG